MITDTTLRQVERACARLRQHGQPVTFTAVASATGLGRTTLYRDPTLRALIETHRARDAAGGTLTGITDELATLRTAVEVLAQRVGQHEEQIRQLARKDR